MLCSGGGALYLPLQAETRRTSARRFMIAPLLCWLKKLFFPASEPGAGDEGHGEAGEGVLKEVLLGLVVEEVLHFEVDPQRTHRADACAAIDAELRRELRAVELIARHRAAEGEAGVAFEAVAGAGEAGGERGGGAVAEVMAFEAGAQVDGVEEGVREVRGEAVSERESRLELDAGDARRAGIERLDAEGGKEL